jgi:hypothetical protein
VPLFECRVGGHNLLSLDQGCERLPPLGPVGYISTTPAPGTVALYRCILPVNGDHFVSSRADCEGQHLEGLLGYAVR